MNNSASTDGGRGEEGEAARERGQTGMGAGGGLRPMTLYSRFSSVNVLFCMSWVVTSCSTACTGQRDDGQGAGRVDSGGGWSLGFLGCAAH